ncbi:MAG: metal-dependent transcriptional regulator [Thermoanaerobaculia bacterium]
MATSTVEDYLKRILLEEQGGTGPPVSPGRIGAALKVAPGTVTAMLKTLAASGLITYEPYTGAGLTDAGRELAMHVLRRHRLIELFLVQVMGMDWSEVHDEAEHLEHAVSDLLIARIDEMLGHPAVDPHGDPIPTPGGEVVEPQLPSLVACVTGQPVRVARVLDQAPAFLQLVEREGLKPGCAVEVLSRDRAADTVVIGRSDGEVFSLGFRAASKIEVEALAPVSAAG